MEPGAQSSGTLRCAGGLHCLALRICRVRHGSADPEVDLNVWLERMAAKVSCKTTDGAPLVRCHAERFAKSTAEVAGVGET